MRTGYQVAGDAFDPRSVGLDLLFFVQVNDGNCFAIGKDASGTLKEIKFGVVFMGIIQLKPEYIRNFSARILSPRQQNGPIHRERFSISLQAARSTATIQPMKISGRSLPISEERSVTMIKLINGGNTMLAGTEGALYHLDVSTGKFGDIIKKQTGIPGQTIDAADPQRSIIVNQLYLKYTNEHH